MFADLGAVDVKSHFAAVHAARVALGARHRHDRAIGHVRGCLAGADHGRDAEFTGDDRRVAGATAAIGDDRRGGFHDRFPVRRGGVGHQHLAGLEFRQLGEVLDPPRRARGDPLADSPAFGQHLAAAIQHIGFQRGRALLGGHRLRASLDHVELAVDTILGPLHVHRPPVVLLDGARVARQFQDVGIGEAEPGAVELRCGDVSRGVLRLALDEDHLHALVAEPAAQHRPMAGKISRLVDIELVRIDGTLNHILAQAVRARHEHGVAEARFGVEGEHHARRRDVRAHHLHHADRQRDLEVVEALVDSVVDGAIGEKAGKTAAARIEQALVALDVQIRILLAGEARRGQVLRGRRAAHGETHVLSVLLLKRAVAIQDLACQIVGQSGTVDDLPGALGFPRQRGDIGGVEVVEFGMQAIPRGCLVQHVAIGRSGDGEPVRHTDALIGQLLQHLAERCVLPADQWHVVDAEVLEEADIPRCAHDLSSQTRRATRTAVQGATKANLSRRTSRQTGP